MNSIIALLLLLQSSQAQLRPQFSCFKDFSSVGFSSFTQAMRISIPHREFASAVGFGRCLNLPDTMVLRVAGFQILGLPEECLGITIGAALIQVNGNRIRIPICMDSFEGGGPQVAVRFF